MLLNSLRSKGYYSHKVQFGTSLHFSSSNSSTALQIIRCRPFSVIHKYFCDAASSRNRRNQRQVSSKRCLHLSQNYLILMILCLLSSDTGASMQTQPIYFSTFLLCLYMLSLCLCMFQLYFFTFSQYSLFFRYLCTYV